MYRALGLMVVLALAMQGCAKRPEPRYIKSAAFFHVNYETWTCEQLAQEADLLSDGLVVAGESADPQTRETVSNMRISRESVRKAMTSKGCKMR
jgi:hypothetical protein